MDHKKYQNWVSGIDELSPLQKEQTQDLLSGVTGENASLMAIEAQLEETRQCPHCKASGAVSKGMARGLRRYQCKACNKSFNAATGTALQGLHNKGKCLAFGNCLTEGMTVRKAAEYVTIQIPQRRSTRPESPIREISFFYQQLASQWGVPTTNAQAVRPRHSEFSVPCSAFIINHSTY